MKRNGNIRGACIYCIVACVFIIESEIITWHPKKHEGAKKEAKFILDSLKTFLGTKTFE